MAKQQSDRTTIDLFADEKRPGRPKTNPNTRSVQLKINKRNQLKRDKLRGLHRIELKVEQQMLSRLNALAKIEQKSRNELIVSILEQQLEQPIAAE